MQTICTKSVALQADDDDLMTSVSQSRYWPHISTNRFIGLTLPPSLLFATSCCPFVSFIVRNAPSPPPPHNPFLPSSPFFLLSPSLSARPATTQPLRPPLHPSVFVSSSDPAWPESLSVPIWIRHSWCCRWKPSAITSAVYCLSCLSERHIFIMTLALFLRYFL